jgi:hypothetical protein
LLDRKANLKNDFSKLKSYLETSGMLTAYLQELLCNVERHVDKEKVECAVQCNIPVIPRTCEFSDSEISQDEGQKPIEPRVTRSQRKRATKASQKLSRHLPARQIKRVKRV